VSGWERRAACGCGRTFDAWRGKTFFVNVECCPDCGVERDSMVIRTVRWVRPVYTGPWYRRTLVKPGFWETKA
jgi:hypothetical protein